MGSWGIFLHLTGGLVALAIGGELLIRGAVALAFAAKVSPLVIGLTVVAFGTSMPELVVSLQAAAAGSPGIAVANVVGSNIFNTLCILGLCGMIARLVVSSQLIRFDIPLVIAGSLMVYLFALTGNIHNWQGLLLFAILVSYTIFIIRQSRRENRAIRKEYERALEETREEVKRLPAWFALVLAIGGWLVLILGARWLIDGSVHLARRFGISETVIGLTIVAAGTSLPEVAASVVATLRGERDIAIGNIIGSNTFNIFGILGIAPLFAGSLPVDEAMLRVDFPLMLISAIACFPHLITGMVFSRIEGVLFFAAYVCYTTWLVFDATGHPIKSIFSKAMLEIVLPLLAPLIMWILWDKHRRLKKKSHRP
ncbi:MAG: calcium/sodium antiporter [Turneriella sp.]|nr:calcium/sodium antiporter [Turneriella sp.]